MNDKNELDEIFVDKNESTDQKLLVKILKPFVIIDKEGIINFNEGYEDLPSWKKILIYLTCRKAMILKGIIKSESVNPKEISKRINVNESTIRNISTNKELKKIIKKINRGEYLIPNYNLKKVENVIFKERGEKIDENQI